MEYKFINVTKDLSTVEMKEQTKINIKTIKLLNEEVTRLKQVREQEEIIVEKNIEVTKETDETFDIEIESDNSLIEEINYYYSRILSEDDSVLKEFLPSLRNSNYQNIVYGICALLLKEITEVKVFIETEKDSLTKQELEDFKEEIINKQRLITEINKANVEIIDKGENEENKISNNIVFSTDDIEITYQELKVEITGIAETGKERDVVVKDAVKSVVTKKYLYAKARQAGIHVTTEEYEAYKTALSTDIQNSENKEAVQAYFDGFGGEENYWKQMEATIMQNLTIHKYLNEQAANEKEIEEIKEKAYTEALTIDEEKELIRIANGIYE